MLKRSRPEVGINDVTRLLVGFAYPFSELHRIRDGCGQEHIADGIRKKNDCFLPDNASFLISHVVNFIKNNPSNLTHDLGPAVKH